MTQVRRFWLLITGLAIACGGRTLVGGVEPSGDGGTQEDGPLLDAPIGTADGPIGESDGPVTGEDGGGPADGPVSVDVIFPRDSIFVPPPDVRPPSDVVSVPPPLDAHKTIDSMVPDVVIVPPPVDSGPDVTSTDSGVPVFCGGEFCSSSDECCVGFGGLGFSASCVPSGDCDAGLSLSCTGSDNCSGGEVCCGTYTGGVTGSASCEPGPCPHGEIQLCTVDGDCPKHEMCITLPIGLGICRH
jgi:hypothetical protein